MEIGDHVALVPVLLGFIPASGLGPQLGWPVDMLVLVLGGALSGALASVSTFPSLPYGIGSALSALCSYVPRLAGAIFGCIVWCIRSKLLTDATVAAVLAGITPIAALILVVSFDRRRKEDAMSDTRRA
jgi:hypothetical protein